MLRGYDRTSARAIAEIAGVDHAMVNYHFGSKRGLFAEAMAIEVSPRVILDVVLQHADTSNPRDFARKIAVTFLYMWDQEAFREPLLGVIRQAAHDEQTRSAIAEFMSAELLGRIAEILGGERARVRGGAVASVLVGTLMSRYVFRLEPFASMPREQLADVIAPMLAVPLQRSF